MSKNNPKEVVTVCKWKLIVVITAFVLAMITMLLIFNKVS